MVRRPRPFRAERARHPAAPVRSQPPIRGRVPRPGSPSGPRDRRRRRPAVAPARPRRGSRRLARDPDHEPAGARLRVQPGLLLPVPRSSGRAARRRRRGPQHLWGTAPLHAPGTRGRGGLSVRGGDGQGVLRLAVHRGGRHLRRPRPGRARRRAYRDRAAPGRSAAAEHKPRAAARAADGPLAAADAGAPSVADAAHDRTDPLARRATVAARRPVLPPWCGGSRPVRLAAQRARETIR